MKKLLAVFGIVLFSSVQAQSTGRFGVFCKSKETAAYKVKPVAIFDYIEMTSFQDGFSSATAAVNGYMFGYPSKDRVQGLISLYSVDKFGESSKCALGQVSMRAQATGRYGLFCKPHEAPAYKAKPDDIFDYIEVTSFKDGPFSASTVTGYKSVYPTGKRVQREISLYSVNKYGHLSKCMLRTL